VSRGFSQFFSKFRGLGSDPTGFEPVPCVACRGFPFSPLDKYNIANLDTNVNSLGKTFSMKFYALLMNKNAWALYNAKNCSRAPGREQPKKKSLHNNAGFLHK
jgi:hypothetical protein